MQRGIIRSLYQLAKPSMRVFPTLQRSLTIMPTLHRMPNLIGLSAPNQLISRNMASHKHKKMIKLAKGYRNRANRCYSVAKQRVFKAMQNAYKGRKLKKRSVRQLWIQRMNAGTRMYGVTYNIFINSLLRANISLNRKVLADLAVSEPLSFRSVVELSKNYLHQPSRMPKKIYAPDTEEILLTK